MSPMTTTMCFLKIQKDMKFKFSKLYFFIKTKKKRVSVHQLRSRKDVQHGGIFQVLTQIFAFGDFFWCNIQYFKIPFSLFKSFVYKLH